MSVTPPRPLLYLDVDGVLNVFADRWHPGPELEQEFVVTSDGIDYEVRVPAGTGRRLRALDERFEIVWATTWGQRAVELLAPHLGIGGRWRVLPLDRTFPTITHPLVQHRLSASRTAKLEPLLYDAGTRPLALVDDHIYADALGAFARRQRTLAPTLALRPQEWSGLTEQHFEHLLVFADRATGSLETTERDAADYISDERDAAAYLAAAYEDGDPALVELVQADIEKARARAGGELPE